MRARVRVCVCVRVFMRVSPLHFREFKKMGYGQTDGPTDGWANGRTDGPTDGQTLL